MSPCSLQYFKEAVFLVVKVLCGHINLWEHKLKRNSLYTALLRHLALPQRLMFKF
jgi:hypothetical protein